jgi:hypothetical protein
MKLIVLGTRMKAQGFVFSGAGLVSKKTDTKQNDVSV